MTMQRLLNRLRLAGLLVAFAALGACKTAPPSGRYVPPPLLQLLEAAPVQLDPDCMASGSYIVQFMVEPSGRTTQVEPPTHGPPCLRQALTNWVESFRYAPIAAPASGSVEWLLAVAPRTGS